MVIYIIVLKKPTKIAAQENSNINSHALVTIINFVEEF